MNYINLLNKEKDNIDDMIIKKINLKKYYIYIINIETITSSEDINKFILKNVYFFNNQTKRKIIAYLLNYLPINNIKKINNYNSILSYLYNGFVIIIINDFILACEVRNNLSRSVSETDYEKTIIGPKDSFVEHYNTNLGLIRRRIKKNLYVKSYELGQYTKTKIGLIYIKNIIKKNIITNVDKKINTINIDGIIDSNYLKKYLNTSNNLFPSIKSTERPDVVCQALLDGKCIIIVDNSPEVLILPTYFIDFFHTSDDYYQKRFNITFIRFIRLFAFLISMFLPAIYISLTTHNQDAMPINLLLSFQSQRETVPFPSFIEAIFMIIIFEVLRETDVRIPSSMGSSISILGGLVLGTAAVDAGIVSPIMIIVIAISAISGMTISSIEAINSIRFYRFILIILATLFGFYGIFIGNIYLLTILSNTKSLDKDYLFPFAPISFDGQKDAFLRLRKGK